jgi:cytochrome b6-f complex iron-sulfur subunit
MSEPINPKTEAGAAKAADAPGIDRRDFLNEVTFGALAVAGLGASAVTLQYFSPNVLFEPSAKFRAGTPELYPEIVDGKPSVTFLQDQQVYIVRTKDGFYAVSAVCTHLGCITQWKQEAEQIACPCHGSKFKPDGTKIEGPAPRALPHFAISLTADGELLVDKLETVVNPKQALKV